MAASKRKTKSSSESTTPSKPNERPIPAAHEDDSDSGESVDTGDDIVPVQVNNACLTELKNALDDTTKSYLNEKAGFAQNHIIEDVKLGLGWISNLLAGGISLAGWYFGWQRMQTYTGYCVAAYAVFSIILTIFSMRVEKKIIYVGTRSVKVGGQEKLTISTDVKSYEPVYNLDLVYETKKKAGPKNYYASMKPHFKQFFDVDGYLDEARWHKYLESALATAVSKS